MTEGKRKPGGRREPPGGRPRKNNVELKVYVKKATREKIVNAAQSEGLTLGEVVEYLVDGRLDLATNVATNVANQKEGDSNTASGSGE